MAIYDIKENSWSFSSLPVYQWAGIVELEGVIYGAGDIFDLEEYSFVIYHPTTDSWEQVVLNLGTMSYIKGVGPDNLVTDGDCVYMGTYYRTVAERDSLYSNRFRYVTNLGGVSTPYPVEDVELDNSFYYQGQIYARIVNGDKQGQLACYNITSDSWQEVVSVNYPSEIIMLYPKAIGGVVYGIDYDNYLYQYNISQDSYGKELLGFNVGTAIAVTNNSVYLEAIDENNHGSLVQGIVGLLLRGMSYSSFEVELTTVFSLQAKIKSAGSIRLAGLKFNVLDAIKLLALSDQFGLELRAEIIEMLGLEEVKAYFQYGISFDLEMNAFTEETTSLNLTEPTKFKVKIPESYYDQELGGNFTAFSPSRDYYYRLVIETADKVYYSRVYKVNKQGAEWIEGYVEDDSLETEKELEQLGKEVLLQQEEALTLEVEYLPLGPTKYLQDFVVGDLLTVDFPGLISAQLRLVEVVEIDEGEQRLKLVFAGL